MNCKFGDEEKQTIVKRYSDGESATDLCLEYGLSRSTFYSWCKKHKTLTTGTGKDFSLVAFNKMEQHVSKLEQIIEVLKRVDCTVDSPLKLKLIELEKLQGLYSVHVLCEALEVSRGTYYNHIKRNKRQNSSLQIRRNQLSELVKQVFDDSRQVYGAQKIAAVLKSQSVIISDKMVSSLMREMNLGSVRNGAKNEYKRGRPKKDILKMEFSVDYPNQVWVCDVTVYNFREKKFYICVILDLYARKAIAHRISKKQSTQLITSTFKDAYERRQPKELIFHSDRGCQFTSKIFQDLLLKLNVTQSFSPSGSPQHNAVIESFFSNMKREELYRTNYRSEDDFKKGVKSYIDWYNNERPHKTLVFKTPNAYENRFYGEN